MIYVTDYLKDIDIERAQTSFKIYSYLDEDFDLHDEVEVLLVWHQKIDKEFLDKFKNVKFIQRYGVGYDVIDLEYCNKNNIVCANNPDYGVEEVALTALSLMLQLTRRTSFYNDFAKKLINNPDGTWQENIDPGIERLSEQTLLIVGFGRIGQKFAQLSCGMVKNIIVYDPYLKTGIEKVFNVEKVEFLNDALSRADIVSIHCPLNDETRGLVNREFLDGIKPGAKIINTARGELVQNLDLVAEYLDSGKIDSVGLDVLPVEPPNSCDFLDRYLADKNEKIVINLHTAYYSKQSYNEMREKAIINCNRFLNSQLPLNVL